MTTEPTNVVRLRKAAAARPVFRLDPERFPALARDGVIGLEALVARTSKPVREVWTGLVAADNLVEISGPSGEGKTTLAVLLAIALANPGAPVEVLGRRVVPIEPGRLVVFFEEENSARSLRSKIEDACEILGLDAADVLAGMLILARRNVRLGDPRWTEVVQLARDGLVAAVFIDSRARVLRRRGHDSDSEQDQAEVAEELFALVEAGAVVFVISHLVKGRGRRAPGLEDIAGSGQRGAAADVVLLVTATKDSAGKVLSSTVRVAKVRDDIDEHPAPVTYAIDGPTLQIFDEPDREAEAPPGVQSPRSRVLACLREKTSFRSKNALAHAVGGNRTHTWAAIAALIDEKLVLADGGTIRLSERARS